MDNKNVTYYSWTKISNYISCQKLFYWVYIRDFVPTAGSPGMLAGRFIAIALKEYRKTGDFDKAALALFEAAKDSILAKSSEEDPKRSIERLIEILYAYSQEYPNEKDFMLKLPPDENGNELPITEVKFEIDIDLGRQRNRLGRFVPIETYRNNRNKIKFIGIIDGLINLAGPAIIEDKTSSWSIADSFFKEHKSSFQVLWELYVANKMGLFGNKMPKCMINGIYIHEKNFKKGIDTGLAFRRDITIRSPEFLNVVYEDLLAWIKNIEVSKRLNRFPRNTKFCNSYGGCKYEPICFVKENSTIFKRLIESEYKNRYEAYEEEHKSNGG